MMTEERAFVRVQRKMIAARIEFLATLARFQPAELSIAPFKEEWSPLQITYHLSVIDGLALEQMRIIQGEDSPQIVNIADLVPDIPANNSSSLSLTAILATMTARREAIFRYLSELPETAWERSFQQEQWGQRKFYQFVNLLPLHDKMAIHQLEAILARKTYLS
jgi:DinB superfamily